MLAVGGRKRNEVWNFVLGLCSLSNTRCPFVGRRLTRVCPSYIKKVFSFSRGGGRRLKLELDVFGGWFGEAEAEEEGEEMEKLFGSLHARKLSSKRRVRSSHEDEVHPRNGGNE